MTWTEPPYGRSRPCPKPILPPQAERLSRYLPSSAPSRCPLRFATGDDFLGPPHSWVSAGLFLLNTQVVVGPQEAGSLKQVIPTCGADWSSQLGPISTAPPSGPRSRSGRNTAVLRPSLVPGQPSSDSVAPSDGWPSAKAPATSWSPPSPVSSRGICGPKWPHDMNSIDQLALFSTGR